MQTLSSLCPLCGASAPFAPKNFSRAKHFSCPTCGEFVISVLAEQRLANASSQWRDIMAQRAKAAPEGFVLLIQRPRITTQGAPLNVALEGPYVLRSDWGC